MDSFEREREKSRSKSKDKKKPGATMQSCETCHLISSVKKAMKQNDMDEVMSEMQTLNIRPVQTNENDEEVRRQIQTDREQNEDFLGVSLPASIQAQVVDEALKQKIIGWLINTVRLLKPMNEKQQADLITNLPQYCRSGVMFADLINRLNGKNEVIKGINRNPPRRGNTSQVQANFTKVMSYFKAYPKFCSRYLWSQNEMIKGNTDVIWGFLDDIWHWSNKKISPYDPAQKNMPKQMKRVHSSTVRSQTSMERSHDDIRTPIQKPPVNKHSSLRGINKEILQPRSIIPSHILLPSGTAKRSLSCRNKDSSAKLRSKQTRFLDHSELVNEQELLKKNTQTRSQLSRSKSNNSGRSPIAVYHSNKAEKKHDNDDLMDLSSFALFPQEVGTSNKSPNRRSYKFNINRDDIVPDPTDQVQL